jgi:hypothetical protein
MNLPKYLRGRDLSEQEENCYLCDYIHEIGDSIVKHYIDEHYSEVIMWYQLARDLREYTGGLP